MDTVRRWGWQQWLLLLGLVLSLAVVALFAARTMQHLSQRQGDEPLRAWMSVPYIAHSYRLPPRIFYAALGLPAAPRDRRPLIAIARAQNRPVLAVIADVQAAIVHARPPYPTPIPDPTRVKP